MQEEIETLKKSNIFIIRNNISSYLSSIKCQWVCGLNLWELLLQWECILKFTNMSGSPPTRIWRDFMVRAQISCVRVVNVQIIQKLSPLHISSSKNLVPLSPCSYIYFWQASVCLFKTNKMTKMNDRRWWLLLHYMQ